MTAFQFCSRRSVLLSFAAVGLAACSDEHASPQNDEVGVERPSADLFPPRPPGSTPSLPKVPASGVADPYGLSVDQPPPLKPYDPSLDDPDVQLRMKLYDHLALINQGARSLFHSPRMRQSLEIHLSYVDAIARVPLIRRRDLKAFESAGRTSFTQSDLAKALEVLLPIDEVKSLRAAFVTPSLSTFAVLLGTSVTVPPKTVLEALSAASNQSDWRRSALAWLTTATRSEQVERDIAHRALPYVVENLGITASKALPDATVLKARADGIAFARTHIATQDLTDIEVYALIRNFEQFRLARAYEAFFQAYTRSSNAFLIAVHDSLA